MKDENCRVTQVFMWSQSSGTHHIVCVTFSVLLDSEKPLRRQESYMNCHLFNQLRAENTSFHQVGRMQPLKSISEVNFNNSAEAWATSVNLLFQHKMYSNRMNKSTSLKLHLYQLIGCLAHRPGSRPTHVGQYGLQAQSRVFCAFV